MHGFLDLCRFEGGGSLTGPQKMPPQKRRLIMSVDHAYIKLCWALRTSEFFKWHACNGFFRA